MRHGHGRGLVTHGGRKVAVTRPRARTIDGNEVPLTSYVHFAPDDLLARMLAGVGARTAEVVSEQTTGGAPKSTSRSAISRRFVKQIAIALGRADGPTP